MKNFWHIMQYLSHNTDIMWDKLLPFKNGVLMAEGVNVRFSGELHRFIQERTGESGLYASASEYIRDLVRHDYEQEEQRKWAWLRSELKAGAEASKAEFITVDADSLIAEAKARRKAGGG